MATKPEFRRVVNYTDLEALLECPLCLDRFDQPRLIPCGHTYCTKCLNELCAGSDMITCPECRQNHDVPAAGVVAFPRNLSYQQLLDIRTEQLVSTRQCQVCDKQRAFSDCLHCHRAVCLDCKKLHRQELATYTNYLLTDLTKSSDSCKDAFISAIQTVLAKRDKVKVQISTYAKELIDSIQKQEQELINDVYELSTEQLRRIQKISTQYLDDKEAIDNFVQQSKRSIESETILDEKYIPIQHATTRHLAITQRASSDLNRRRTELVFTPTLTLHDRFGDLNLVSKMIPSQECSSFPSLTADDTNNRQQSMTLPGVRHIGYWGNGPSQFWCPCGLTLTHNNDYLIIVDSWNHRLQMLTSDGQFVRSTSGDKGDAPGELNNPRDVCINTSNQWIIVSDSGNHRLVVYDLNNFEFDRLLTINDLEVSLQFPFGICCDENDLLYVCDRGNNRIVVVNFHDGTFVRQWGRKGTENGEFDAPDFICYRQNILAVSDFNNHRIQVFTSDGQFLFTFGRIGTGNVGEFRYPRGVAIDDEGFFMVADWVNNRLQLFTPSGELSAIVSDTISSSSNDEPTQLKVGFDRPIGLTVSSQGVVYVTEWGRSHRVIIY